MFCNCYFSVFLGRVVLALVFALEEGGGGSQLKSSVAFPLVVCSVDRHVEFAGLSSGFWSS